MSSCSCLHPCSSVKSVVKNLAPYKAWLIVGLILSLSLFVRLRLRDVPLERDEGEYAYAGQLMLQGVPPYKEAYNMKLPGTYAAYALIMALFGQSDSAIHIGVALINAASILLLFLIGRKILDEPAGVVAAISYALLSTSPSVLGLAGHATHFVVLPALAGTLLLLQAVSRSNSQAESAAKILRALRHPPPTQERAPQPDPSGTGTSGPRAKGLLSPALSSKGGEGEGSYAESMDAHARGETADGKGQMADGKGQMADDKEQMADDKGQRAEGEWQRGKGRGHLRFDGRLLACGVLFGLAFLMKQHGVFFAVFAVIYLGWTCLTRKPRNWRAAAAELGVFTLGLA